MKRNRTTTMLMVLWHGRFLGRDAAAPSAPRPRTPRPRRRRRRASERGAYLVTMMGCNDCHTPWKMGAQGPEPDMTRALTGHPQDMVLPPPPAAAGPWIWHGAATNTAFAGPWGVSFTANLTPDTETGLGKLDRGDVHRDDAHRPPPGEGPADPAADAGEDDRQGE